VIVPGVLPTELKLVVAFNQVPPSMVVEFDVNPLPLGLLNTPTICEGGKSESP
jgi:hypothetical protein